MRAARVTLVACGLAIIGVGAALLVGTLRLEQLVGLGVWLACAVVLHDGVLVPVVTVLTRALGRAGQALPRAAIRLIEGAFAMGMLISLVVGPEIYAQALGPGNATVLPADYGARLITVWIVIVLVTTLGVVLLTRRNRRIR